MSTYGTITYRTSCTEVVCPLTTVCYPFPPLSLISPKPKHFRYPTEILTVGDEVRAERINRGLRQWDVDDIMGAHRGFCNELEMNNRDNTIYVLYKAYKFLGYVPKTLKIDESTSQGKLYAYRIKYGYTLSKVALDIGLDKSTIGRYERGRIAKQESLEKINLSLIHI